MKDQEKEIHVCGKCGEKFSSNEEYLNHECKVTGKKPTDPLHHYTKEEHDAISEAAKKRGEEKKV